MNTEMKSYLDAALEAAQAAEDIIMHYYSAGADVQIKADNTPVTQADVESEQAIRSFLEKRFPEHDFYGEETGRTHLDADYLWLVDPIDGTKSFVRSYPMFSTQIALMYKGELILGVSNAPAWKERLWAIKGEGAWLGDKKLSVSDITSLEQASLSTGNIATLAAEPKGWNVLGTLSQAVHRTRGYGDFLHYHLLAKGSLDLIVESDLNILDIAALTVIVREAGGVMTQLDGQDISLDSRSVLAATPDLHQTVLQRFQSAQ